MISPSNLLLDRASARVQSALQAAGTWNVLAAGERIGEADTLLATVHFPFSAVIGVASEADGIAYAVASFGIGGFTGIPLLFGMTTQRHTFVADRPGAALIVSTDTVVTALREDDAFREAALSFVAGVARQKASAVACSALHVVRQRLARRLLILWEMSERARTLPVARSTVARFAGADHRTAARALRELHAAGAMTPLGATVTIDDPVRLRALACSCCETDAALIRTARESVSA